MASPVRTLSILAGGLAAVLASAPAAAEVLVVRSLGSAVRAYPPGRSLPDDATLNLRAGDMVTVLGAAGTRTFRGPGAYRVTGPSQVSPLARAMAEQGRRNRVGAVRGSGGDVINAGLWDVDVTRSGTVCIVADSPIVIWRPGPRAATSLNIRAEGMTESTLSWPTGSASIAWPASVSVESGAEYQLELGPDRGTSRIRFAMLPVEPTQPIAIAAQFIHHGCQAQLDRLLETTPAE